MYTYDGDRSKKDLLKFIAYRRTTEPGQSKKKGKAAKQADDSEDDEKDEL